MPSLPCGTLPDSGISKYGHLSDSTGSNSSKVTVVTCDLPECEGSKVPCELPDSGISKLYHVTCHRKQGVM